MEKDIVIPTSKFTIRTSDRRVFRRCLRKWDFLSSMRQNLTRSGAEQNINFWFGSAIHFAMEDFHGWNRYGDPRKAFYAYYKSFKEDELPLGAEACYELGMSMLSYYLTWLPKHNQATEFETVWLDDDGNETTPFAEGAHPAVEQQFMLPLNVTVIADKETMHIHHIFDQQRTVYTNGTLSCSLIPGVGEIEDNITYWWTDNLGRKREALLVPLYYHGTMDRIVKDKYGRWWILDYKTAKGADTNKLDTDDQIDAYIWAAIQKYNHPIYGFVYLQLTKDAVQEPKRLKNGDLSVDKKQKTTYSLLKLALMDEFGAVNKAPSKYIQFLNDLASKESPEGDRFIRWDFVKRTDEQVLSTARNIYAELHIMLDPNLYCYPNPTRDCIWDCPVRDACISLSRGDKDDLELFLKDWEQRTRDEDGNIDPWREDLPTPELVANIPLEEILNMAKCMTIELDSNSEDATDFKFMYDDDERD